MDGPCNSLQLHYGLGEGENREDRRAWGVRNKTRSNNMHTIKSTGAELADYYKPTWLRPYGPNATYRTLHTTDFNGTSAPVREDGKRPRNAERI